MSNYPLSLRVWLTVRLLRGSQGPQCEHELLWSLSSWGPGFVSWFPCRSEPHTLLGCLRPGLGVWIQGHGALCSQLGYISTLRQSGTFLSS